jgi:diguanylate cyclase (GGDEF)-like protein
MSGFPVTREVCAVIDEPAAPRTAEELAAALDALEMLPYEDPEAAHGPAVHLEREAVALGATDAQMRALLVQADVLGRRGRLAAAGRIARDVNRWAAEQGHSHVLARSHRLLSSFFHRLGDSAASLEHSLRAVELLGPEMSLRMRADHEMALAISLGRTRSFEAARERSAAAEAIAAKLGNAQLRIAILNNAAYIEYWAGEPERAMEIARRMQAIAQTDDATLHLSDLDTIARIQMELGRYAEAEQTLRPLAEGVTTYRVAEADEVAECLLTLGEVQRLRSATGRAARTLARCAAICEERDLASVLVRVRLEQAELYAAEGRFREAYEQHKAFHAAAEALNSAERDARARTLQVVFETEEARRDSRRFEEMSLRDPLTGLYNRRFVDDRLPVLLHRATDGVAPLSVALVDLDHFKLVNDTHSHEVGDAVLLRVGEVLTGVVGESGYVARMGGEEFLLLLPDTDAPAALERSEQVRTALRAHPWEPLVGTMTVRASIGTTTVAGGQETQATLLARADRNLYAAKRSGRDRVVAG